MCLHCVYESNPRTWRPFNPASIIGMSRIRGCLQERAPRANPRPPSIAAVMGRGEREEGREGERGERESRFLATTHYFPVVAFDVDGPGHSKRLIENFLRVGNGARNAVAWWRPHRGGRSFIRRLGAPIVEREWQIHLFNM